MLSSKEFKNELVQPIHSIRNEAQFSDLTVRELFRSPVLVPAAHSPSPRSRMSKLSVSGKDQPVNIKGCLCNSIISIVIIFSSLVEDCYGRFFQTKRLRRIEQ